MRIGIIMLIIVIAAILTQARAESPSEPDREAIREIVREYLIEHPEIIEEAIGVLRERRELERRARARAAIRKNTEALHSHPMSPVSGNPDGDVTVVEFFDYRCAYCKRSLRPVLALLKADRNVRIIWKEFPILGPESRFAARAAMAADRQGRYHDFHVTAMDWPEQLTEAAVIDIAGALGLDTERLRRDINDPEIEAYLEETAGLARALGITGTPAFLIGDTLVPGALDEARLSAMVEEARSGG